MVRSREPGLDRADFGHDDPRGDDADTRDLIEAGHRLREKWPSTHRSWPAPSRCPRRYRRPWSAWSAKRDQCGPKRLVAGGWWRPVAVDSAGRAPATGMSVAGTGRPPTAAGYRRTQRIAVVTTDR